MKGKKERREKKGEGKKERRKKMRREKKGPQQGSNPLPSTLQPTAYHLKVESHVPYIHRNLDFDDLHDCGCAHACARSAKYIYIAFHFLLESEEKSISSPPVHDTTPHVSITEVRQRPAKGSTNPASVSMASVNKHHKKNTCTLETLLKIGGVIVVIAIAAAGLLILMKSLNNPQTAADASKSIIT